MPFIIQNEWFTKEQVYSSPGVTFVFGDNEQRRGFGGQAKVCRGFPNTIGIRTKVAPTMRVEHLWYDKDCDEKAYLIDQDFWLVKDKLIDGETIIYPADGVGTGMSCLHINAPLLLQHIELWVEHLKEDYSE